MSAINLNTSISTQQYLNNSRQVSTANNSAVTTTPDAQVNVNKIATPGLSKPATDEFNACDGLAFSRKGEEGSAHIEGLLTHMTRLASTAADGTHSQSELHRLNHEFQALMYEVQRVANTTQYSGYGILSNNGSVAISVGSVGYLAVQFHDLGIGSTGLNIAGLDLESLADSQKAFAALDNVIESVKDVESDFHTDAIIFKEIIEHGNDNHQAAAQAQRASQNMQNQAGAALASQANVNATKVQALLKAE